MADNNETEVVEVDGGLSQDSAVLLLAAAEELDLPPDVVETTGTSFRAPRNVVAKAGLNEVGGDKPAAKKAAKKATSKDRE